MKDYTIEVHGCRPSDYTGSITQPIYMSATFRHPGFKQSTGYDYSRCGNPTRDNLEETISQLEQALSPFHFFRIHRSFLVNFRYIYRIDSSCVCLDDGQKLPLSRHRRKEVQQLFLTCAQIPPVQNNSMEV